MRDQDKVDVWFLRVFAVIDHGPTVRAKVRNDLSAYALHRSAFLFRTRVIGMSTKPTVTFRQLPLSFTRLVRIKHEDNQVSGIGSPPCVNFPVNSVRSLFRTPSKTTASDLISQRTASPLTVIVLIATVAP